MIPDETEVRPMYVRKSDVATYGRTPGCKGCRDIAIERPKYAPHNRECHGRMEQLLTETEAGQRQVKASEDRWVQAAVRRSDIIFAEAEEKHTEWRRSRLRRPRRPR